MPGRTPFGTSVVKRWPSSSLKRSCWPGLAPGGQIRVRGATMLRLCCCPRCCCPVEHTRAFVVPRARRRRFGAALSPGEAALSLETAILAARPRLPRRRGAVAGRPHSCGPKRGAQARGNCRWPLHQQRRRCDSFGPQRCPERPPRLHGRRQSPPRTPHAQNSPAASQRRRPQQTWPSVKSRCR